ncbi:MAG: type II secretion system protein [Campylobacterota bacterium]|nr:type II secretion system protein [Campylobacterota bacterium]
MEKSSQTGSRPAFSLLELMIVILIISLSYVLVFSTYKKSAKKPKSLTPMTLKSTLLDQGLFHTDSEFFCLDKCQSCYLYQDDETGSYEGEVAFGDIKAYTLDQNDNLYQIDFGRYQDHPVCLRFGLHHNGSSSQMVIESKGKFYFLPAFFGEAVEVESLAKAKELWLQHTPLLANNGDYY